MTRIIDKHLQKWVDKGLNKLPVQIEIEMANPNEPMDEEGWQKWYPIDSTVTNSEIAGLEEQLKFRLPESYKIFLQHKHFYELYISDACFSGQEIREWKLHFFQRVFNGFPRELLIDKGYMPFADWSDWGQLCFDTNSSASENEYPIVRWDHDRWNEYEFFSENFQSLLLKLDTEDQNSGS